jgi:hypothetical protein
MSALSQTPMRGRGFCSAIALLVVVLLMCGIGTIGLVSDTRDLNLSYPDSAVLTEEDSSEGDQLIAKGLGGEALSDHRASFGPSAIEGDAFRPSGPPEGQVTSILRDGGIQRATHPTGPPDARA